MRWLEVVLVALLVAGCGRRHIASDENLPEGDWTLTVNNRHWLDVSITLLYDGGRRYVGTVSAAHNETYTLPYGVIAAGRTVRFEGNPIGAIQNVTTDAISVRGGGHVEWTLESGLERSTVAVW